LSSAIHHLIDIRCLSNPRRKSFRLRAQNQWILRRGCSDRQLNLEESLTRRDIGTIYTRVANLLPLNRLISLRKSMFKRSKTSFQNFNFLNRNKLNKNMKKLINKKPKYSRFLAKSLLRK
jgi:hypothetical protein